MKRLGLLVVFIVSVLFLHAGIITESEARKVAVNWINNSSSIVYDEFDILQVNTRFSKNTPLIYVVNFKPKGWVMVSATDRIEPVIGFSADSKIDFNRLPVQMEEWLEGIQREIVHSFSPNYLPDKALIQKWSNAISGKYEKVSLKSAQAINSGPLLTCTWDQGRYYNEMAPYDATSTAGNNHVWIGCVATAMAQLMHYWSFPSSGMGSFSYSHADYGLQSVNFGTSVYNWSSMPDHLTAENSEVQQINYHVAVAIRMDFDPQGSGAHLVDAKEALINYFKYNSAIFESSKNDWDDTKWKNLLKSELNKGRPVIYAGYTYSGSSGHAFVCDGYTGDYFHFNWGWGGYANGNFLLSSLNPGGTSYSYNQSALLGIEPVTSSAIGSPYIEGFESSTSGDLSLTGVASVTNTEKHSGSYSLKLSESSFSSYSKSSASITFLVPADGQLSFWVKRKTPESSSFNQQSAVIYPQYGQSELVSIFDGDFNDDEWVNYTCDLSGYEGQYVRLMFIQQNFDVAKDQWMYIDDLVITGSGENLAPFTPSLPVPTNAAAAVPLTPQLQWSGGDPNGNFVTYSVYFGTNSNPPFAGSVTDNKFSPGTLNHSTTYYWKVVSDDGYLQTSGPVWSFVTQNIPPDMGLCGISNVAAQSATVCGQIINTNNSTISSRGICWGTSPNPTILHQIQPSSQNTNTYTCELNGLSPFTTYYARAYAVSDAGTAYSSQEIFTTLRDVPQVGFSNVSNIHRTSAQITGTFLSKNDDAILNCGVVWSVQHGFNPALAAVENRSGFWVEEDSFQIELFNLPGPGIIYFRTFAENSVGLSYSAEGSFETFNTAPNIYPDPDNSSSAFQNNFNGWVTEQEFNGTIADIDVAITDLDNDTIEMITIVLQKQVSNDDEFLLFTGDELNVLVQGNGTDTIMISKTGAIHNNEWCEILKHVVLFINNDSPDITTIREVSIMVNDGFDNSNIVVAYLAVVPSNDPPINVTPPQIAGIPEYKNQISIKPGEWLDVLDHTNCSLSYRYQWQVKREGEVFDIENGTGTDLILTDEYCGDTIRVVETVTDYNCGGNNMVLATIESEWIEVQRSAQTVVFDLIPVQYYSEIPFKLSGESSSGLPLTFAMNTNTVAHLSNDSVFIDAVGRTVVSCAQVGNICYLSSEKMYRILTVEQGFQEILFDEPGNVSFAQRWMLMFARSSAGLPLEVSISDNHVAEVINDTIFFKSAGTVDFTFSQAGNEYILPAETVHVPLTINKGEQLLSVNLANRYQYGDEPIDLDIEISSQLNPVVEISNSNILKLNGNFLDIVGVGTSTVSISHPGDDFYLPVSTLNYSIEVTKGNQQVEMLVDDEIRYGANELNFAVNSSSGLSFTIESSDSIVLQVKDGKIYIVGVGLATLTLANTGNEFWNETEKKVVLEVLKGAQNIVFDQIVPAKFGDNAIELVASTVSGLPVEFVTSNETVATVDKNWLTIHNAGECYISALQNGNEMWESAKTETQLFNVGKALQHIETNLPDTISVHDEISPDNFWSSSGLPIDVVSSSDESIVSVEGNNLTILKEGKVTLMVSQTGNQNFEATASSFEIVVIQPVSAPIYRGISAHLFPNPASDKVQLSISGEFDYPIQLHLINSLGELQMTLEMRKPFVTIDVHRIPPGVYFLVIQSECINQVEKLVVH